MSPATKNFHLPLPEALYEQLRSAAKEADQPATKFAQDLVQVGLDQWRRAHRRQQIAAYAQQVAGSSQDLDRELEHAGITTLVTEQ
jgi:hypothetical protein